MLITPIQPHNSLNSIILNQHQHRGLNLNSPKMMSIISAPKNNLAPTARYNVKPKIDTSQQMGKKKTSLEMKLEETMRNTPSQKLKSIQVHKDDLMLKKKMLSDILTEYELISKDKNVLTAEINNMKKYLSDIRTKLDQSLTVLNKNTTLFALKRGLTNTIFGPKNVVIKPKRLRKSNKKAKQGVKNSTSGVK